MSLPAEIVKAISDHAIWKARLRIAIEAGTSEYNVPDISADYLCAFGKWLHSLPDEVKATACWETVQELHAEFHLLAAQVLNLALNRQQEEANEAMKSRSTFVTVSSKLTQAMLDWKV